VVQRAISGPAISVQVFDFIDAFGVLRKWAKNLGARRIKQLAQLWAGSAQSYPQSAWKVSKVVSNQALGVELSIGAEDLRLTPSGFVRCA
jgi:hypothetical protein